MDEFQQLMTIRQRYSQANALGKAIMRRDLQAEFQKFTSPSVRKAAMTFLDAEIEQARISAEESQKKYAAERTAHCTRARERLQAWRLRRVPLSVARAVVSESAWWLTHSSGSPVRAPRHASRIEKRREAWTIEFGANSFEISTYVSAVASKLLEPLEKIENGGILDRKSLLKLVRPVPSRCVANYKGDRYEYYAPEGEFLVFGAQALSLDDLARYIVGASGLSRYAW